MPLMPSQQSLGAIGKVISAVGNDRGRYYNLSGASGFNTNILTKRLAWADTNRDHYSDGLFGWLDANENRIGDKRILDAIALRDREHLSTVAARPGKAAAVITAKTIWRLLINASPETTPHGTGISLHDIHGHPLIPSSSLRGTAARQNPNTADLVFGRVEGNEAVGLIAVGDGQPCDPVQLCWDAITPHSDSYDEANGAWPNEWGEPTPVSTLAIDENTTFRFTLWTTSHDHASRDHLETAVELLSTALTRNGIGAKTSSGYGYFHDVSVEYISPSGEVAS